MYIVIRRDKAEHLKEKLHKAKEVIAEIAECFEEAHDEYRSREHEDEYRERARRDDRYYDDDDRDMARGRGGRSRGGMRY